MAVVNPVHNEDGTSTYTMTSGGTATIKGGFEDAGGFGVHCTALSGATVTIALANDDGTAKVDALLIPVGSATGVVSFTAAGAWRVDTSGFTRAHITSTGGTCTLIVRFYRG